MIMAGQWAGWESPRSRINVVTRWDRGSEPWGSRVRALGRPARSVECSSKSKPSPNGRAWTPGELICPLHRTIPT